MSTSPPHRAVIPRNFPAYVSQYQQPVTQTKSLPQATFLSIVQVFNPVSFPLPVPDLSQPYNHHYNQKKSIVVLQLYP